MMKEKGVDGRKATIAAIAGLLLIAVSAGRAQDAAPLRDEPYPVELRAGETFKVCESGQIVCPAIAPICDDPKMAVPVDTPHGLGFKVVRPGTTLCSAATPSGQRRIFRITVYRPDAMIPMRNAVTEPAGRRGASNVGSTFRE